MTHKHLKKMTNTLYKICQQFNIISVQRDSAMKPEKDKGALRGLEPEHVGSFH